MYVVLACIRTAIENLVISQRSAAPEGAAVPGGIAVKTVSECSSAARLVFEMFFFRCCNLKWLVITGTIPLY